MPYKHTIIQQGRNTDREAYIQAGRGTTIHTYMHAARMGIWAGSQKDRAGMTTYIRTVRQVYIHTDKK